MIPKKKRQRHKEGDVFAVPLGDGSYALGQILSYEPEALNSVGCAFYGLAPWDDWHDPRYLDGLLLMMCRSNPESCPYAEAPAVNARPRR